MTSQDSCDFQLKWIEWNGTRTPIIMQNHNGPCSLLALCNALLLRGELSLTSEITTITSKELINKLGALVLERAKDLPDEEERTKKIQDAMTVFPKLLTGLDINLVFDTVTSFESTSEMQVFNLLGVKLYHGWLPDPNDKTLDGLVHGKSYNKLQEDIINAGDSLEVQNGFVVKCFLQSSQLTCHGLNELKTNVPEGEIVVLFGINHFSTVMKKEGRLLMLASDVGYVKTQVWQVLEDIKGNGEFIDAQFKNSTQSGSLHSSPSSPPPLASPVTHEDGQDALCTPQLVREATVPPVCDQQGCCTDRETSLGSTNIRMYVSLVETQNYDELDSSQNYDELDSSSIVSLIETFWTSALKKHNKSLKGRCIGLLVVTMEDGKKLYVLACSSHGLTDEVAGSEANFKHIWEEIKGDMAAIDDLKLNAEIIISPVGSSRQCYRGVPCTKALSKFERSKQENYCKELMMRMERRRGVLRKELEWNGAPLNYKQLRNLRFLLEQSVYGVKCREEGRPAEDFEIVFDFHKNMIERETFIKENISPMLESNADRVENFLKNNGLLISASGNKVADVSALLRQAIDLGAKTPEEHMRRIEQIEGFRVANDKINEYLNKTGQLNECNRDILLQTSYSGEINYSRFADYVAQCAEDNATIAFIKWLEKNPDKRVKSVVWFSTEWSEDEKKVVHKPLCSVCEIRFKDRLEWLIQHTHEVVVPKNYAVELTPDLKAFTFSGKLQIDAEVITSTSRVVLNSSDITIISASANVPGTTSLKANVTYSTKKETVTFEFPSALPKGEVTFHVQYTGILNDQLKGFYRSKYYHPSHPEEERYMAVTQFEPIYARRALPCWDEPAIKATFDVTMVVPKHLTALSNMNEVDSSEEKGDLKRVTFARSPVMSIYLLAFIVGEFDYVEKDLNGVLVRVYTPLGKGEHGRFALEVAVNAMAFYKDYFNRPYPLPKLDLVSLLDLASEAMENWGLITCRDILVDTSTSLTIKKDVALSVCHQLACQWFGNLVTMELWTYNLWLKKGLTAWMAYFCVNSLFPKYQIWTQFQTNVYANAMKLDAFASSYPIEVPANVPSEIEGIGFSYCKGASIIHMLHSWIGDEAFRRGINQFLNTFQYKNAYPEDLWKCLEKASKEPVGDVMETWTRQMGFPVLTVEDKHLKSGNKMELTVSQENINGFNSVQWMVPITVATKNSRNALTFVLNKKKTTVKIKNMAPEDWILVNPGGVGYFRVNYSSNMFEKLVVAMEKGEVKDERDRLAILEDTCALAHVGVGRNMVDVLKLLESYKNQTSYAMWKSIIREVRHIGFLLSSTDFHNLFKKYALSLFEFIWAKIGWEPKETDSHLDALLRPLLLQQRGFYGDQSVLTEAKKKFKDHLCGRKEIAADLKSAVYNIVAYHGDEITYQKLSELLGKATSTDDKICIYHSLVHMSYMYEQFITMCLESVFSGIHLQGNYFNPRFIKKEINSHDILAICKSCLETVIARDTLWVVVKKWLLYLSNEFIVRDIVNIAKFRSVDEKKATEIEQFIIMLGEIINIATSCFVTEEKAIEIEQFFKHNPCPVAERSVKLNCESTRMYAKRLRDDAPLVKKWLSLNVRKALPTDVVPKNYAVELTPDLKKFTFSGKLRIDAEVITSTSRVVLNSSEITIISASVEVPGTFNLQNAKVTYSTKKETVTFEFPSALPKGRVTFHMQYTGILNDQLKGFYRSKYYHPSHPEEERYMTVTQFERIYMYARRALPCWDEPAIKATFDVTMVVPKHLTALSNMLS